MTLTDLNKDKNVSYGANVKPFWGFMGCIPHLVCVDIAFILEGGFSSVYAHEKAVCVSQMIYFPLTLQNFSLKKMFPLTQTPPSSSL